MNPIVEIDRIVASYERTGLVKTITQANRVAATAAALGIPEELVHEALKSEGIQVPGSSK